MPISYDEIVAKRVACFNWFAAHGLPCYKAQYEEICENRDDFRGEVVAEAGGDRQALFDPYVRERLASYERNIEDLWNRAEERRNEWATD